MNSFWASFIVGDEERPGSSVRRQSIYDAALAFDSAPWTDTTSFLLFKTATAHEDVAKALADRLIDGLDVLLVGVVGSRTTYMFGMADQSINTHLDIKALRKPWVG